MYGRKQLHISIILFIFHLFYNASSCSSLSTSLNEPKTCSENACVLSSWDHFQINLRFYMQSSNYIIKNKRILLLLQELTNEDLSISKVAPIESVVSATLLGGGYPIFYRWEKSAQSFVLYTTNSLFSFDYSSFQFTIDRNSLHHSFPVIAAQVLFLYEDEISQMLPTPSTVFLFNLSNFSSSIRNVISPWKMNIRLLLEPESEIRKRQTGTSDTTGFVTTEALTTLYITSSPMTTSPLTTSPLTTSPLTSSPLSTSPLTTSPLTTSPLTTSPVTSSPLTTNEMTSGDITTNPLTTSEITSGDITTSPLTTEKVTTSPLTTNEQTSGDITTSYVTSSVLTTANEAATSFGNSNSSITESSGLSKTEIIIIAAAAGGGSLLILVGLTVGLLVRRSNIRKNRSYDLHKLDELSADRNSVELEAKTNAEKSEKKLSSPLKLGRTLSMTFSSFESEVDDKQQSKTTTIPQINIVKEDYQKRNRVRSTSIKAKRRRASSVSEGIDPIYPSMRKKDAYKQVLQEINKNGKEELDPRTNK